MRLLEKKEVWKERQQEEGQLVRRGMKISDLVNKQIEIQNRLKDEQAKIFEDFKIKTEEELQKFHVKLSGLQNEVKVLEDRKHKALEPLTEFKQLLSLREKKIEEEHELLSNKEKRIAQDFNNLFEYEQNLVKRESVISEQEEQVKNKIVEAEKKIDEAREATAQSERALEKLCETQKETEKINEQKLQNILNKEAEVNAKLTIIKEINRNLDLKREEINKKLARL